MNQDKITKLQAAGWTVGNADDFFGLSPEESMLVDLKIVLSKRVKEIRQSQNLTQKSLAAKLGSSQSRVAGLELSGASASLDLLFRSLFALGESQADIAKTMLACAEDDQSSIAVIGNLPAERE